MKTPIKVEPWRDNMGDRFDTWCRVAISKAMVGDAPLVYVVDGNRLMEPVLAVSESLGALGTRVDPGLFEMRLEEALYQWQGRTDKDKWNCIFLRQAATALREALDNHAEGIDHPEHELAYCVSEKSVTKNWQALRKSLGLVHDHEKAALASQVLWKHGVQASNAKDMTDHLTVNNNSSLDRFEYLLSMAECLARVPGMEDLILRDLTMIASKLSMPIQKWGTQIIAWPLNPIGTCETIYPKYVVAHCAYEVASKRESFPWGVWLAIALPDKVACWGPKLVGAEAEADLTLLRALACYKSDETAWSDAHRKGCAQAISMLEALVISEGQVHTKISKFDFKGRL